MAAATKTTDLVVEGIQMYYPMVLQGRCPKIKCQRGCVPLETLGENPFPCVG